MAIRNGAASARLGFRVLNVTPTEADLDIFDVIGDPWEGTTAADFVKQLRDLKNVQQINLHINSPGGYVNDGLAMYNAIQQHPANVTAFVESEAASAASFVAMAADKIVIAKNAKMMIHDASGFGIGNASDFRALADMLDEESQNIATIYADRTDTSADDWRSAMQANNGIGTTYRGQEAVNAGLADEVMTTPARNAAPMRVAAHREDDIAHAPIIDVTGEDDPEEEILIDLIPPLANGYKAPLPADFTRLLEANLSATKG